ncbi:hypothetical protein HDU67_001458 [Dinochytrium kinnereticum]|nr:hypothetical protein HDU67_001458 [Dinochytrium kinnereticum]
MATAATTSIVNHSSVNVSTTPSELASTLGEGSWLVGTTARGWFLRWSALLVGVYWGYSRKSSLTHFVKERAEAAERQHYEDLVEEGKVAFEAAYNREQAAKAELAGSKLDSHDIPRIRSSVAIIIIGFFILIAFLVAAIDSDSYRFNAERWINWAIADSEGAAKKK